MGTSQSTDAASVAVPSQTNSQQNAANTVNFAQTAQKILSSDPPRCRSGRAVYAIEYSDNWSIETPLIAGRTPSKLFWVNPEARISVQSNAKIIFTAKRL